MSPRVTSYESSGGAYIPVWMELGQENCDGWRSHQVGVMRKQQSCRTPVGESNALCQRQQMIMETDLGNM